MTPKEAEEILLSYASPNGIGFSEVKKAIYVILDEYHKLLESNLYICDACKNNPKNWDKDPCDGCCTAHSGFVPKQIDKPSGLIDSKKAAEEFGQLLESGFFETCPLTQEEIDRCLDDLRKEEEKCD